MEDTNWDRYTPANLATTPTSSDKSKGVPVSIKHNQKEIGHNDDWQLNPKVAKMLFNKWGQPKEDLFASARNKQARFYFRKESDLTLGEGCLGEDALRASWNLGNDLLYANPPWRLAEKTISKIHQDEVSRCILVLPFKNEELEKMSIGPS